MWSLGKRGFSIIIFAAIMALIIGLRPHFLIDQETGQWKSFGFGAGKSFCNITAIAVIAALFSYMLSYTIASCITNLKDNRKRGGGGRRRRRIERFPSPHTPKLIASPVPQTPTPVVSPVTTELPSPKKQYLAFGAGFFE